MGDLLVAWLLFPAILAVISLGCGAAVDGLTGGRTPRTLLIPLGLAAIILAGYLTTTTNATAELTTPLVVAIAIAGLVGGNRWRRGQVDGWAVGAAAAVFAVFAAPVVLSGEATFAGYIKLDDSATWFALTDLIMDRGHDVEGLAPSSFEATVTINLNGGYPVGPFIPLGVGTVLTGIDVAWLFQPFLTLVMTSICLVLYELTRDLLPAAPLRAGVAFLASQPALLFAYAMWGGIKELEATLLVALIGALVAVALRSPDPVRAALLPGVAVAAMVALLGIPGGAWLIALFGPAAVAFLWTTGRAATLKALAIVAAGAAAASIPLFVVGDVLSPTEEGLTAETELGNLAEPLRLIQVFGVWPTGDFRGDPVDPDVAYVLIAIVGLAALLGLAHAVVQRAWGLLVFGIGGVAGFALISVVGSPWIDAKAMVTASAALLLLAGCGAARLFLAGRRPEAAVLAIALATGVLWSNGLAFAHLNLAPRDQLEELELIGEEIDGKGPALMTEYQPYGVRHFLREADAEGASELRRRTVLLADGTVLEKGEYTDTDQIDIAELLVYRTLVLRRSPAQSRPPSPYTLVASGDYYTVWQRPPGSLPAILEHLALGNTVDPAATAPCPEVRRLAGVAGPQGRLAASPRGRVISIDAPDLLAPPRWRRSQDPGYLYPEQEGALTAVFEVAEPGAYHFWLGGSLRGEAELEVDGQDAGGADHQLNNLGQYVGLGTAGISAGEHELQVIYRKPELEPGIDGDPPPMGPLVISPADEDAPVRFVDASQAEESLCGKRWDWVEALG